MIGITVETIQESTGRKDDIVDNAFIAGMNKAEKIIDNMTIFVPEHGMVGSGLSVRLKKAPDNPGTERNYGMGGKILDL